MRPGSAFGALIGLALGGALLIGATVLRFLRAGIPLSSHTSPAITWHGLLIPGAGDLYIHLVSYALLTPLLGGVCRAVWRTGRQLRRTRHVVTGYRGVPGAGATRLARAARCAGLAGRCDLVDDARPLAFCQGLRHPRVVVSTGLLALLEGRELEAVLRHEAYHAINRDPLRLVVADFLASAFFFLPILGLLRDQHVVAAELAADRHAMRGMGGERNLAAALCKLLLVPVRGVPVAASGAMSALALRVDALLGEDISPRPRLHPGALIGAIAVAASLTTLLVVPLSLFAADGLALHHPIGGIFC